MRTPLILAALAASSLVPASAQDLTAFDLDRMVLNAHPAVEGVSAAFLAGAFDAEGLYAANSVLEEGALFPPHAHPDDRLSIVLEGTMYLGTGEEADPKAETAYPAGTAVLTPAGTFHWMAARDGDIRILEIGSGPSGSVSPE